jgi:hypothetical protein
VCSIAVHREGFVSSLCSIAVWREGFVNLFEKLTLHTFWGPVHQFHSSSVTSRDKTRTKLSLVVKLLKREDPKPSDYSAHKSNSMFWKDGCNVIFKRYVLKITVEGLEVMKITKEAELADQSTNQQFHSRSTVTMRNSHWARVQTGSIKYLLPSLHLKSFIL